MPIGSESDRDVIRPKHQMAVLGLGVFIAPNAVARLFRLHDYTKCSRLGPQKVNKHGCTQFYDLMSCSAHATPSQAGGTVQTPKKENNRLLKLTE